MRTIVLASQKGGSGKSTLAIGLALAAQEAGHHVHLIDTDPQATLLDWRGRRDRADPPVETVHEADDIEAHLTRLQRGGATLTVIDTASGVTAATTAAIGCADLCLVPARPCAADIEATGPTLRVIKAWKKPFAFVLNQTPIRSSRMILAAEGLGDDGTRDVSDLLARPFIAMRSDHRDAQDAGLAVGEYAPDDRACEEIAALWRWVDARMTRALAREAGDRSPARTARFAELATASPAMRSLSNWGDAGAPWNACL